MSVAGGDSSRAGERQDDDTGGQPPVPAYFTVGRLIEALQKFDSNLVISIPERWNYEKGDAGRMVTEITRCYVTVEHQWDTDDPVRVVKLD